jgi:L-lactate dehydrogenase complex protein LldG
MATKEAFLATVREALAKGGQSPAIPAPEIDVIQNAADLRKGLAQKKDALLAQLQKNAVLQEWNVVTVASEGEARDAIIAIAKGLDADLVVRTSHPIVERLGLDEALAATSIESVLLAASSFNGDREQLQDIAARANIGVTGVDYLIAETASASLVSREGMSRMASLLPPVHIAVAHIDQVMENLGDLLTLREAELADEDAPNWYMNLVSGPSKTADIEQTIVIGVHGPGEVHLVVITG